MQRRAAPLTRPVHIDSIKRPLGPAGPPHRSKRLPARRPRRIRGVNPSRVERQARRATKPLALTLRRDNLCRIGGTARVGLVQTHDFRAVEVRLADVATRLAAVGVGDGVDGGEGVGDAADGADGFDEGGEGGVGGDDAVVGGAGVVLDFLDEEEVGGFEVVCDVGGDLGEVGGGRGEVLDVVAADGDGGAFACAAEGGGGDGRGGEGGRFDGGQGEDVVEAECLLDHAGDVLELVAHLGGGGVLGAVERGADDDGLWVRVWVVLVRVDFMAC